MRSVGPSLAWPLVQLLLALVCLGSNAAAHGSDSYDGTHVRIPVVVVNGTTYFNAVVSLARVVGVAGGAPVGRYDSYDGATGVLTMPSVQVGATTYTNVQIAIAEVVSVGGASSVRPVIKSVDNSSPVPLSILRIGTTGLTVGAPAYVSFTDGSGYSVTLPALRVAADGTVTIGAPFYADARTGAIAAGTVTATVGQGANVSAPVTIAIQDIPALSSYGTQTGAVTRSFLSFAANLHAIRINEFLAVQTALGGKTDTSAERNTMIGMLSAAIAARSAVDSIIQNGAYVEPMSTLADGTRLQMDQSQLILMDRIIANFLTQQFAAGVASGSLAVKTKQSPLAKRATAPFARTAGAESVVSALNTLLASMNGSLSARAWALGQADGTDAGLAAADGVAALTGLAENQWVGGFLSFAHITAALESMFHAVSASAVCLAAPNCSDTTTIQENLNSSARDFVSNYVQAIAATSSATRFAGALVNLTDQSAGAYRNLQSLYGNGALKSAATSSDALALGSYLLGVAKGTVTQQAGASAPTTYLNFCCFGSGQSGIVGFPDVDGAYSVLLPTGLAGTNYSALRLDVVDASSGATMASQTVNLSGLNSRTPTSLASVNYCTNGETNYPTCAPTCANGATDYPKCTPPPPKNCLAEYNVCVATPACNPPSNLITQNQCINACLSTWLACL